MIPRKVNEVKGARTRLGYTQQDMADYLGITLPTYRKRESGVVKFTDEDKAKLTKLFEWDFDQMNRYLYDGMLPFDGAQTASQGAFLSP